MKWTLAFLVLVAIALALFWGYSGSLTAGEALQKGNHYFNVDGRGLYDLDKAEEYFQKALELDPNVPDAWHQLARIDFLRGNFDSAIVKINTQLELHGDSLMASYYIRGLIEGFQEKYPAAEKDFQKFLTWDPHNWAGNNDLAWIYFAQGKFEMAESQSRFALEFDANNPWLLLMHGVSLMNLGRKEEAKEEIVRAKEAASVLSSERWSFSYPGNDPRIAPQGVVEMQKAIERNLALVETKP